MSKYRILSFLQLVRVTNLRCVSSFTNPGTVGYGYRPCTSHFALLGRQATHDVITVHNHTNYKLASTWTLPTLDAQGLKWAPCGRWIAVWESAASGYKVLIYTSDGHLYRTYDRQCDGLGVKSVEWSPNSDFLTIGSYDGRMVFLSNYTFSPVCSSNPSLGAPNAYDVTGY